MPTDFEQALLAHYKAKQEENGGKTPKNGMGMFDFPGGTPVAAGQNMMDPAVLAKMAQN